MKTTDAHAPLKAKSLGNLLKTRTADPEKLELNRVFDECLEKAGKGERRCVVFVRYHDLETLQAALEDTEVSLLISENVTGVTVLEVAW